MRINPRSNSEGESGDTSYLAGYDMPCRQVGAMEPACRPDRQVATGGNLQRRHTRTKEKNAPMNTKSLRLTAYGNITLLALLCLVRFASVSSRPGSAGSSGKKPTTPGSPSTCRQRAATRGPGLLGSPNKNRTDGPLALDPESPGRHPESQSRTRRNDSTRDRYASRGRLLPRPSPSPSQPLTPEPQSAPLPTRAYPGEKPVISGGNVIRNWQADDSDQSRTQCDGKLWRATVPATEAGGKWRFNQLFVNGERRTRARVPNKGSFFRTDGPLSKDNSREFYFHEGDVKQWDNLRDVIFVVYHSWETSIHHVRNVDTEAQVVTLYEPAPWGMGTLGTAATLLRRKRLRRT